jgi:hypothetical protein
MRRRKTGCNGESESVVVAITAAINGGGAAISVALGCRREMSRRRHAAEAANLRRTSS